MIEKSSSPLARRQKWQELDLMCDGIIEQFLGSLRRWCEERDLNPHAISGTSPSN